MSYTNDINNVRRKINEVMKKTEERIVVGWRPELQDSHQEGDIWEGLDGRKWTIKNGIKQTVTKLDGAKTPLWCPKCNKSLNHRLDAKFWRIRGHCMDCNIKEETSIKAQGLEAWHKYEQKIMKANYIAELKDNIEQLTDLHQSVSNFEVIHADSETGNILMVEKWDVDVNKIKDDLQKDITFLQEQLTAAIQDEEPSYD